MIFNDNTANTILFVKTLLHGQHYRYCIYTIGMFLKKERERERKRALNNMPGKYFRNDFKTA